MKYVEEIGQAHEDLQLVEFGLEVFISCCELMDLLVP